MISVTTTVLCASRGLLRSDRGRNRSAIGQAVIDLAGKMRHYFPDRVPATLVEILDDDRGLVQLANGAVTRVSFPGAGANAVGVGAKGQVCFSGGNDQLPFWRACPCTAVRRQDEVSPEPEPIGGLWYNPRVGDQYQLGSCWLEELTMPSLDATLEDVWTGGAGASFLWHDQLQQGLRLGYIADGRTAFCLAMTWGLDWILCTVDVASGVEDWRLNLGQTKLPAEISDLEPEDRPDVWLIQSNRVFDAEVFWLEDLRVFLFQECSHDAIRTDYRAFAHSDSFDFDIDIDLTARSWLKVVSADGTLLSSFSFSASGGRLSCVSPSGRFFTSGPGVHEWQLNGSGSTWSAELVKEWRSPLAPQWSHTYGWDGPPNLGKVFDPIFYAVLSVDDAGNPIIRYRDRQPESGASASLYRGDDLIRTTSINSSSTMVLDEGYGGHEDRVLTIYGLQTPRQDARWLPDQGVLAGRLDTPIHADWDGDYGWGTGVIDDAPRSKWAHSRGELFYDSANVDLLSRVDYLNVEASTANIPHWLRGGLLLQMWAPGSGWGLIPSPWELDARADKWTYVGSTDGGGGTSGNDSVNIVIRDGSDLAPLYSETLSVEGRIWHFEPLASMMDPSVDRLPIFGASGSEGGWFAFGIHRISWQLVPEEPTDPESGVVWDFSHDVFADDEIHFAGEVAPLPDGALFLTVEGGQFKLRRFVSPQEE